MATARLPILGAFTMPDDGAFFAPIKTILTLGSAPGNESCLVLDCDPASDIGVSGKFPIPKNYSADPVLAIQGIIDGTPANNIHSGFRMLGRSGVEDYNVALEAEDISTLDISSGFTDEGLFTDTIALTVTVAIDDAVSFHYFIDASPATPFTGNALITGLFFQYTKL